MGNFICLLAIFFLMLASHAWAGCTETRQVCERRCNQIRHEINRLDNELNGVTGNGGWAGSTRSSERLAREEAAACADPDRRTRVQGVGTYGHQRGYRSGFDCNTRNATELHQRNVRRTTQLRQAMVLQQRAEENTCDGEASLVQRIIFALN